MTDEQHLRQLLDARYSRSAIYAADDTPSSLYSVSFFSPRPNDSDADAHSYRSPQSSSPPPLEARTRLNELATSMLDFDDEPRYHSHSDDDDAADTIDASHDSRMSFGPRMRLIEPAPWELSDTLEEEDEPEPDRSRGRDGFKTGLGFRSSSRGTTTSSRPSVESSRSHQAKPKRSFETTSSSSSPQGRRSPFNVSNAPQSTGRTTGLRLNFPFPRSESPSSSYPSSPRVPASPHSVTSHHSSGPSPFPPNKLPLTRRATNDSTTSQSHYSEDLHPYANPDLVVSYADDPSQTPAPNRSVFRIPSVARSESSVTITESLATTTSLSRSVTGSTLTPDTSTSSMLPSQSPRARVSTLHGKEISAPLPVHPSAPTISTSNISSPLMAPTLPPGQNFALISLEEARAQRSRSATAQNLSISSTSSTSFPETLPPFDGHNQSPTNSVASRSRARSISTGARAKAALHNIVTMPAKPERRDSEPSSNINGPPAKSLKHKKSGFMRLFNSGRGSGDDRDSPPPVPPLSDEYAAFNAPQSSGSRSTKSSIHRVPPPEISPSMLFESSERLSPRPSPPALSIRIGSQGRLRAASTVDDFQTRTVPSDLSDRDWHQADLPQSAPPNVTEFPALKLRPVSTLFSSHFADHMVLPRDSDSQPSLEADADTSSSTSPISITPITPATALGPSSGDKERTPMATISEDQSALVQALQEQLVGAKKAWQRHIWVLEGQVRGLKMEVERLRASDGEYCETCGRGTRVSDEGEHDHKAFVGVVNRPRARTGTSSRLGSAV